MIMIMTKIWLLYLQIPINHCVHIKVIIIFSKWIYKGFGYLEEGNHNQLSILLSINFDPSTDK